MPSKLKYLSLFSGIGGFEYAVQEVFGQEAECIGYSEIDPYATSIYRRWYPTHPALGDIRNVKSEELPDFDLLVGGFPCQSFSICGERLGFSDTRGTLFYEIGRILSEKRPTHFLLENVKGLLSNKEGETFTQVLRILTDLGYACQSEVLNSRFCGVPQNRERVFIYGTRATCTPTLFPIGYEEEGADSRPQDVSTCIDANYYKGVSIRGKQGKCRQLIVHNVYGGFNESKPRVFEEYAPTIRTPQGGGHIPMVAKFPNEEEDTTQVHTASTEDDQEAGNQEVPQKDEDVVVALTERRTEQAKEIRREANKAGKDFCPRRGKELTARKDGAIGSLTTGVTNEHLLLNLKDAEIRTLTPIEAERLQGYPDGYTHKGAVDIDANAPVYLNQCAKRHVVAVIKKNGKVYGVGHNNVTRRNSAKCMKPWQGEPFDICEKYCGKNEHAEIMALREAGRKYSEGATMYIMGHHWCCDNCMDTMYKAGIKRIVFTKQVPRVIMSNTRRFHALGNSVTTNAVALILTKLKEVIL